MTTEADARARAVADLRKLLLNVESSYVHGVSDSSRAPSVEENGLLPRAADELWYTLDMVIGSCGQPGEESDLLLSLLKAGAVNTLVGLLIDFSHLTRSETSECWATADPSIVSGPYPS